MTIRNPDISISLLPSSHRAQNAEQKMLYVGQMTSVGSATSGALYEDIGNNNEQDALFGKNSMLATMIRAAKYHNKVSQIDAIPLQDHVHTAVTFTQLFTSSTGFTFNASNTEFVGSRLQQKDDMGSYAKDVIVCPDPSVGTVLSYATFTAVDDGTIRYIVDGKYWTGTAWAASSSTWATASPASAITVNIATLTPTGTDIALKVVTNDGSSQMWVSSVIITYYSHASAVAAAGAVVFSGTATAAGTLTVSVGSKGNISTLQHAYSLPVAIGDTATDIGADLVAAITADTTAPVTSVNTTGSVALTAVHTGTEGNFISLSIEGTVAGLTYTLTGMTGGATNPILTTLFDVVGDTRYQSVVYPDYVRETAKAFLDARFNVDKKILDGVGFSCMRDTATNIASSVAADNSQSIAVIANKLINTPSAFYVGAGIFEINTIIASQIAAIRALRLTDGTSISQYVSATYGSKDAFGGMHIASLPYFNTIIPTLPLENTGKCFTDDELASLTAAGAITIGNNIANTSIIMGTTVTTYKTDVSGDADTSFQFLEYVDTEVTCREYFYVNLRERFANSRLTDGAVKLGYNMANEQVIASELTGLYVDLANVALTKIGIDPQTGIDWLAYFKQNLLITLDLATGLATVSMLLPIVTQLRAIRMTIQVSFSSNS